MAPGITEAMREEGRKSMHLSSWPRSMAVIRGRTRVVNLSGAEGRVRESLEVGLDLLPQAHQMLSRDAVEQHPVEAGTRNQELGTSGTRPTMVALIEAWKT